MNMMLIIEIKWFLLSSVSFSLTDKDECTSNNGGCEHICANSYLSYVCHCRGGYTAAADNKNCNGSDTQHIFTI